MASSSNPSSSISFMLEGNSIHRPPIFNGDAYSFWKIRMKIFIEAIDLDVWDAIENGPFIPSNIVDGKPIVKPRNEWNNEDKRRVQFNLKAKNIIMSSLGPDEFFRVSNCESAHEMWNTLQVTHEGTNDVKRSRINTLTHEYELFRMHQNESIQDMQKRFTHIINHLASLGKVFSNEDLTNKVLRCLSREWQPKVTAIAESNNLATMSLATLFGKLQEHEQELSRLNQHEEKDKKNKDIALKAYSSLNEGSDDEENDDDEDLDESFRLLLKRFGKFLKRKGSQRRSSFEPKKDFKKKDDTSQKLKCYECGQPGHIKLECPQYLKKVEKYGKKSFKDKKNKRAYITWDDIDSDSSSDSEKEEANICLMAIENEIDEEVHISNSSPSFDELQDAFNELLEESLKLSKIISSSSKTIKSLENEISKLTKEIEDLKIENETPKVIEEHSHCMKCLSYENIVSPSSCNSCIKHEKEIRDLKSILSKFTYGKNNLEILLGKQRCVFDKVGLGYNQTTQHKSYKNFLSTKVTNFPSSTCFYCGNKGHITSTCNIRKFGHDKHKMIWVPKGSSLPNTNTQGPKKIWVPK